MLNSSSRLIFYMTYHFQGRNNLIAHKEFTMNDITARCGDTLTVKIGYQHFCSRYHNRPLAEPATTSVGTRNMKSIKIRPGDLVVSELEEDYIEGFDYDHEYDNDLVPLMHKKTKLYKIIDKFIEDCEKIHFIYNGKLQKNESKDF